jgi:hypothetical protein
MGVFGSNSYDSDTAHDILDKIKLNILNQIFKEMKKKKNN